MTIIIDNSPDTELPVFTHELTLAIDHLSKEHLMKTGISKLHALFNQACPNTETTILFYETHQEGYFEIYAQARANDPLAIKKDLPLLVSTSLYDTNKAIEIAQQWGDILNQHTPQADFQILLSNWETHLLTRETPATHGWDKVTQVKNYFQNIKGVYAEDETKWLTTHNQFRLVVKGKGSHADKLCKDFSNWWIKKQHGLIDKTYIRAKKSNVLYNPEIYLPRRMAITEERLDGVAANNRTQSTRKIKI